MAEGLRFELLGPLRALRDGTEVPLGPPRQRAVLAVLLLQEGRPMSYEALVSAVWGGEPPSHVRNLAQKYVSGLRRAFTAAGGGSSSPELVWTGSGYRLENARIDDLAERRTLLREALSARESGDLHRAGALARQAEELWRGEFAEGLTGPYLDGERRRWAEKRLMVLETRLAGDLELGRYRECVPELTRQVAEHPLRERLVGLLMLALYRSGRPSDALLVYEETRRRLAEEANSEPGPALRELHARITRQDPSPVPESALAS
ncbi:BTAD domain-containing putative transcriptional regulator [Streptomyces desertarenae]|uniref:BTAD domain-containing putative transcriptional regulator n=1 Tax=Streptomyces desertarenae TaxID=2666184 RepID=A0ABW4PG41_9ACTN